MNVLGQHLLMTPDLPCGSHLAHTIVGNREIALRPNNPCRVCLIELDMERHRLRFGVMRAVSDRGRSLHPRTGGHSGGPRHRERRTRKPNGAQRRRTTHSTIDLAHGARASETCAGVSGGVVHWYLESMGIRERRRGPITLAVWSRVLGSRQEVKGDVLVQTTVSSVAV